MHKWLAVRQVRVFRSYWNQRLGISGSSCWIGGPADHLACYVPLTASRVKVELSAATEIPLIRNKMFHESHSTPFGRTELRVGLERIFHFALRLICRLREA
jgi:hypothetical protein